MAVTGGHGGRDGNLQWMAANLVDWKTKREATAMLNCSDRTLDRLVDAKRVQKSIRRDGSHNAVIYNIRDLERVAGERSDDGAAFLMPDGATDGGGLVAVNRGGELPAQVNTLAAAANSEGALPGPFALVAEQLARLSEFAARYSAPPVYVSLKEAIRITGLSGPALRRAAEGNVKTLPSNGGVRYRRADLEAL